jgi:hypothetical protein
MEYGQQPGVLPTREGLDPTDPIFHVFLDIDSLEITPQDYDLGRPIIRKVYEGR